MVAQRLKRLFADRGQEDGIFDPESIGFKQVPGTQVYRHTIKSSRKRPIEGDLSAKEIEEVGTHIFNFLRGMAEEKSPREIYKSAGALIGRNERGHVVVLLSVNAVPLALERKGINGEVHLKGWQRDQENATVHFEMHCQLAAGKVGKLKNTIVMNCDYMCPNCAALTTVFGAQQCLVDVAYQNRPLFHKRIKQGGFNHSITTNQLLGMAGVQMFEHHPETGLTNLVDSSERNLRELVAHDKYKASNTRLRDAYMDGIYERMKAHRPDAQNLVAVAFKKRRGRVTTFYAAAEEIQDHPEYGGHKPGVVPPIGMALIAASARGHNLEKAEIYVHGKLDVNDALFIATANPAALHLPEGYGGLSEGARKILFLSGINIVVPQDMRDHRLFPLRPAA